MLEGIVSGVSGFSFGVLSSAGVFTVLVAVGLIPRFAEKTHTGRFVLLYEEMVVLGTITGCFFSIFPQYSQFGAALERWFPKQPIVKEVSGQVLNGCFGLFSGMFVGCLALAIAEMLDSIPIFTRRVSLKKGIGLVVLSIAGGKLAGALYYFVLGLGESMGR